LRAAETIGRPLGAPRFLDRIAAPLSPEGTTERNVSKLSPKQIGARRQRLEGLRCR
jgi:hypothetical protein